MSINLIKNYLNRENNIKIKRKTLVYCGNDIKD